MFNRHIHPADLPLFSNHLSRCQRVLDIIRREQKIELGSDRDDLMASYLINFYKRGITDEVQLLASMRTVLPR